MSDIAKLTKEKVMRPSLIDSVDKINEIIEGLDATDDSLVTVSNKVDELNASAIIYHSTQGPAYGPLASVTAKGHAEQDGIPTPSDPKEIVVVRGHEVTGKTGRYVDLVVTADGKTTTTPIPLPSRGWVGSLPDGTHDALSIDGAGKVTWELADAEVVFDGSENWTLSGDTFLISDWREANNAARSGVGYVTHALMTKYTHVANSIFIGNDLNAYLTSVADSAASFKTWLQSNPMTMLYPLATPTTLDVGYVDLPDIPEGAVVSMPELEGLGVESWNNDIIYRYVSALIAREVQ